MQVQHKSALLIDQTELDHTQRLIKRVLQACLRERLLTYTLQQTVLSISLPRHGQAIMVDQVSVSALQKFKMNGLVKLVSNTHIIALTNLSYLLDLLTTELQDIIDPVQWQVFRDEMINCARNEAMVVKYSKKYNKKLARRIRQFDHSTLIDFLRVHYSLAEQLIFFEQWAAGGHPYHPCHKTKMGFSEQDYRHYSPEFNPNVTLHLAAIAKTVAHVAGLADYPAWFARQFPQAWLAWQAKLRELRIVITDYLPLFVHPWQYEQAVKQLFAPLLQSQQLLVFTDIGLLVTPSSSFRTLIAHTLSDKPHIKLPVAVQSTSTLRTVSPASVRNGPACSNIILNILANEPEIHPYCKLAYDHCGVHVLADHPTIARHLSILYRENPLVYVRKQQMPIMVAALFEISPVSQLPLFIEILHNAVGTELQAAQHYFDRYCEIKLRAFLDILLIYGIALDAHQQNTLAVFENDHPVFMITRDLGDIRIHTPTFTNVGLGLKAYPSAIMTDDADETTKKFLHCVVQYHLGELVLLLAEHYQIPEAVFWRTVKKNILKRFVAVRDRISPERYQQVYDVIFAPHAKLKGLMHMRMNDQNTQYTYIDFNNPLQVEV